MRRLAVASFMAVLGAAALASQASAVPSFTRQTGLTCNQCHVTFANVPDFTFTGKKFRLNGYRTPYVAEKIESGEEGALSGNRLMLGIQNIFSLRFRNTFLSKSKAALASNVNCTTTPTGTGCEAGPLQTNPGSTISWFYVGAIGEHIGIWNEFYLDNSGGTTEGSNFRLDAFDEYDVKFVINPGYDNIVGFGVSTQSLNSLAGFSPFNSGTPNHMQRGGIGSSHTPYLNMATYALIKDRALVVFGVQSGENNYNFSDGMNYQTVLGYAFGNSDHNQLWYVFQLKAGNDGVPIVSTPSLNADRVVSYGDAITGIRATRTNVPTATRTAYLPTETGDFVRTLQEIHYGFVDRGPHSLSSAFGFSLSRETYEDGAEVKQNAIGGRVRYMYDRTWGAEYTLSKSLKYDFTDQAGRVHEVSNPWSNNATAIQLYYRPAMNFAVGLSGGINRNTGTILDDTRTFKKGWSWSITYDFMF